MNCIGLDLGTGAIKGVCWNSGKGILKKISERIELDHPAPDQVEIDPETVISFGLRLMSFRLISGLMDGVKTQQ